MLHMLLNWLLVSIALLLIGKYFPGITILDFQTALIAVAVMSLINISIRPLILLLTLPLNFISLGLFTFVINALMFALSAWLVPGFEVNDFTSALLGSLLLTVLSLLTTSMAESAVPKH